MKPRVQKHCGHGSAFCAGVLLDALLIFASTVVAQPGSDPGPAGVLKPAHIDSLPPAQRIRKEMLFADVTVQFRNGGRLVGYFLDLEKDTMTIIGGGGKRRLPLNSLTEVRIEKEANAVPVGVYGMVIGGYLVSWLIYRDEYGTGFMREDFTTNAYVPLLVAVGIGGICYALASAVLPDERRFSFSGDSEYVAQERERFTELVVPGEPRGAMPTRVHVLLTGGSVGYAKPSPGSGGYWYSYPDPNTRVYRAVRKLQAGYSILPWLHVGGAIVWLDEPAMYAFGSYQSTSDANGYSYSSASYSRMFTGNAYLALGSVAPLQSILPEEIGWQVGGGIGVGTIDYRHTISLEQYNYSNTNGSQASQVPTDVKIQGTKLAATLFTQVDLFLYRELSVGLAVDYTFMPGTKIPAVPEWGLKSEVAGNTCVGIGIGLHF
jgi:hypothetical protein